jgi:hypothetical protein
MQKTALIKALDELDTLGGHPRFYELLLTIAELHARKNHDYSKDGDPLSNFRQAEWFQISPFKGILLRMGDKWSRIAELSKKEARVSGESMLDSLMDNAVYSLLAIILWEEENKEKKA